MRRSRRLGAQLWMVELVLLFVLALVVALYWRQALASPWVYLAFSVLLAVCTTLSGILTALALRLPLGASAVGALFAALPEVASAVFFWGGMIVPGPGREWFYRWWRWERIAHWPGYLVERLGLGEPQHWSTFTGLSNPPFWQTMTDTIRINFVSGICWSVLAGSAWLTYKRLSGRVRSA